MLIMTTIPQPAVPLVSGQDLLHW